jgi:hypothetical protein
MSYDLYHITIVRCKCPVSLSRRVWRYQREVIRICISKKDRQCNDQKKRYKRTNNLQNIHIKLKIE